MKTEKNIMIAFILNLSFSVFEFIGGFFTGSVAIISDAVHDLGDALSIGISWILERKSRNKPTDRFSFGYARYSVLGGLISTAVLVVGSIVVIYNSILRIVSPTPINYDGMIIFGIFGVVVNLIAAFVTREGDSVNQKAVSLHMLEDVFGWIVVLLGAVVMRFTDIAVIDPAMSIGVSTFILVCAVKNMKEIFDIFLEKVPDGVNISEVSEHLKEIPGVEDVHHLHIWSMDGQIHHATLHAVTAAEPSEIKRAIREELSEHGIGHATIELEASGEECLEKECRIPEQKANSHHHHHH